MVQKEYGIERRVRDIRHVAALKAGPDGPAATGNIVDGIVKSLEGIIQRTVSLRHPGVVAERVVVVVMGE